MATIADGLAAIVNVKRQIPVNMGLRQTRVHLRCGEWLPAVGGAEIGKGSLTNTDVEIIPRPRVEDLDGQRLRVGPITPPNSGGGYSPKTLNPDDVNGRDAHILVTKPDGEQRAYRIGRIDTEPRSASFSFFLELEPLDVTAPY